MIIAIDGPAGSGKSSTARTIAEKLGIVHLDTGAMYRAITLKCIKNNIAFQDIQGLSDCVTATTIEFTGVPPNMRVLMDGEEVTREIRSDSVSKLVSDYCKPRVVRDAMVRQQRLLACNKNVVCEGRDIGSVVFPDADLKFYMVASIEERAKRRQKDYQKIGIKKDIKSLITEIETRDFKDSTRDNSPLCKAFDAEEIDTTAMTLQEQVEYIFKKAHLKLNINAIN